MRPDCIIVSSLTNVTPRSQLWRLEVACTDDPELWAKKRSDEGELVEVGSRQLGGIDLGGAVRRQT